MKHIIHLSKQTKNKLESLKKEKETYDDVINRLLDLEESTHNVSVEYR